MVRRQERQLRPRRAAQVAAAQGLLLGGHSPAARERGPAAALRRGEHTVPTMPKGWSARCACARCRQAMTSTYSGGFSKDTAPRVQGEGGPPLVQAAPGSCQQQAAGVVTRRGNPRPPTSSLTAARAATPSARTARQSSSSCRACARCAATRWSPARCAHVPPSGAQGCRRWQSPSLPTRRATPPPPCRCSAWQRGGHAPPTLATPSSRRWAGWAGLPGGRGGAGRGAGPTVGLRPQAFPGSALLHVVSSATSPLCLASQIQPQGEWSAKVEALLRRLLHMQTTAPAEKGAAGAGARVQGGPAAPGWQVPRTLGAPASHIASARAPPCSPHLLPVSRGAEAGGAGAADQRNPLCAAAGRTCGGEMRRQCAGQCLACGPLHRRAPQSTVERPVPRPLAAGPQGGGLVPR